MAEQVEDARKESKGGLERRPPLKTTRSAPLVPLQRRSSNKAGDGRRSAGHDASASADDMPQRPRSPASATASTSPTTPRAKAFTNNTAHPSSSAEQDTALCETEPVPDVNIVVLGAANVGKSTFIRHSLSLSSPPASPIVSRNVWVDESPYLVRLVELSIEDVEAGEDSAISWPDKVGTCQMPRVDGVLTLYDVGDKSSFENVPETLKAIDNASLPSMLVSCKCDIDPAQWQVDPYDMDKRAKTVIRKLGTLQSSSADTSAQKQGVLLLINAIRSANIVSKDPAAARRRTLSSAAQLNMSRPIPQLTHTRASSDFSILLNKDAPHTRHDSSIGGEPGSNSQNGSEEKLHRSFLNLEESQDSASFSESGAASLSEADDSGVDSTVEPLVDERGCTFDSLVDRLLLLPKTKADSRYRAIFLALYKKFAAPGQLLEAIVHRFEALESAEVAFMSRTVSQLRYLSVIEQWIGTYPGDFAHPRTKRRMRTFVAKLATTRIFTAAAREMSADLDVVVDDDDTDWACGDEDREREDSLQSGNPWPLRSSRLLDDPSLDFSDNLGNLSLSRVKSSSETSAITPLPSSYGLLHTVDLARRQAQSLAPTPRMPINKMHWRSLIEMPNETIARELTRIDWIMFSAIRPRDFVRHVSLSAAQKKACKSLVHVNRMIDHFNHLRDWVANFILLRDKAKHRVLMLEKLMQVARRLRDLNNYNSLGAFLAGINSAAVHRLSATRELLSPEIQKDWMKLEILMSPTRSYSAYRLAWENSSGERIPFVPLPLRDLVGSQEGNKTFIGEPDGRINWQMFEVMGEVIVGIQKAQGQPYRNLALNPKQDELRSLILNTTLIRDDEALYDRSVQLEPGNALERRGTGLKEFFKRSNPMMG